MFTQVLTVDNEPKHTTHSMSRKSHIEPLPIRSILIRSQNLQVTHKIVNRTGFVEMVEETKKDLWITVNTQGIREKYNIESFLYAWSF